MRRILAPFFALAFTTACVGGPAEEIVHQLNTGTRTFDVKITCDSWVQWSGYIKTDLQGQTTIAGTGSKTITLQAIKNVEAFAKENNQPPAGIDLASSRFGVSVASIDNKDAENSSVPSGDAMAMKGITIKVPK